jgi:hypothetical protein
VYIAAVFERRKFEKFGKYDNSLENSGGNKFSGKLFVIKVFLMFNLENIKDLSVSIIFYRTVALTNLII